MRRRPYPAFDEAQRLEGLAEYLEGDEGGYSWRKPGGFWDEVLDIDDLLTEGDDARGGFALAFSGVSPETATDQAWERHLAWEMVRRTAVFTEIPANPYADMAPQACRAINVNAQTEIL